MKAHLHKISAVFMSAIVLLSTLSFTVDKHFCGDFLVDVAVFKSAKSCGMEKAVTTDDCGDSMSRKSCCSDEQVVFDSDQDRKESVKELSLEQQYFVVSFISTYQSALNAPAAKAETPVVRPPPLVVKDYQILYETFLI
jgi:hypothetical protein